MVLAHQIEPRSILQDNTFVQVDQRLIAMASEVRSYDGVPVGALFEAAQKAVRNSTLKLVSEDPRLYAIEAKSGTSLKSFGQEVRISMAEIGMSSELSITTSSGQLTDWGEGRKMIDGLYEDIDANIAQIRSEGRITASAPVYGMGQASRAPDRAPPPAAPEKKEKASEGGSWFVRFVMVAGVIWLINTESGSNFIRSLLSGISVERDVAKYDCDKVAGLFKGEKLQNAFGGSFKIVKVSNTKQVSKTLTKITCTGMMDLSNGKTQEMRMTVEKSGSDIMYRAEPV